VEGREVLLGAPSLLITDDDRDLRETLRSVFEPRGFRTLLASDGEQALHIAGREPIHLLLTDMYMPRLDGLETIRRIRQLRSPLPCILLSARFDEVLVEEAKRVEVFSFLPKPVSCRDITQIVTRAMRTTYGWP
jgi:CheY-like chemotaxis protein